MRTAERRPKRQDAPPRAVSRAADLGPAGLLALQRGAGNAAVARMLAREPAAPAKGYDFEVTIDQRPLRFHGLDATQVVKQLRTVWRMAHDMLDSGRAENQRQIERRKEHRTAVFWSDLLGGVEVPDPDMWNEVGRGPLAAVRDVLDSTDAALKEHWAAGEAVIDRGLPPELERSPLMQEALAFDATRERIERATRLLEQAAADLRECQRKLDAYVEGSIKGATRAITGIKVSIVVLEAGAGGAAAGAVKGAGLLGQAAVGAGTTAGLGAAEETFNQVGELRIGEREHFDLAKIAKRGAKDLVTGFVGGVIGGKFAQVLGRRLSKWGATVSDELLAAHGLTRAQLTANGPQLFADWLAGSVASSPFTTATGALMDRALEGRWTVQTWGEFAERAFDDMVASGAMGGFLTFAGHAVAKPAADAPAAHPPEAVKQAEQVALGAVERAKAKTTARPPSAARPVGEEAYAGSSRPRKQLARPFNHKSTGAGGAKPRRETRVEDHPLTRNRQIHDSAEVLRAKVREALAAVQAEAAQRGTHVSEIDQLIGALAKTDPVFAVKVRTYFDKISDPKFLENAMVALWRKAAKDGVSVARELELLLGGTDPVKDVHVFRNTPGLEPKDMAADFARALQDPRVWIDGSFANDVHGAHIHAFQQWLGDLIWGPGKGLEFRQDLLKAAGPTKTQLAGTDKEHKQPFWSRLWDELFDAPRFSGFHSAEDLFAVLLAHLDFPFWTP
jgi:hypothetical protein